MEKKTIKPTTVPRNEELLNSLEAMGFPIDEVPEPSMEETTSTDDNPFVFSLDLMDKKEDGEKFELNKLQEAMKEVLRKNSKEMARARFFINGEDENGIPYGNFNGAGPRAITMYQPDHPDADDSGKNYGKVFYRWGESRVVGLMEAIFKECGWDPSELLEE